MKYRGVHIEFAVVGKGQYIVEHKAFSCIVCNSMHVVDSERQREKMAEEFYNNYKREIEMYQKSIQKFIDSGGTSPTVIERWIKKINALSQKKSTYENILRQRLDNLDKDYSLLKMQAQELIVRNNKS